VAVTAQRNGRELGLNALDEYTEVKSVWINDGQP
jgi:acyl-CoA reductase-like NAD-dependent aldehyde dehydrogenase